MWKKNVHTLIEYWDIRQNHWTIKLGHSDLMLIWGQRSSLLMWKKYDHILNECWNIGQNHWTVKLGNRDLGVKGPVIFTHNEKAVWSYSQWVLRCKAKLLTHEIRPQWPLSTLVPKIWWYSLIIWKKYENISILCQDIRLNTEPWN